MQNDGTKQILPENVSWEQDKEDAPSYKEESGKSQQAMSFTCVLTKADVGHTQLSSTPGDSVFTALLASLIKVIGFS